MKALFVIILILKLPTVSYSQSKLLELPDKYPALYQAMASSVISYSSTEMTKNRMRNDSGNYFICPKIDSININGNSEVRSLNIPFDYFDLSKAQEPIFYGCGSNKKYMKFHSLSLNGNDIEILVYYYYESRQIGQAILTGKVDEAGDFKTTTFEAFFEA